VYIITNGDRTYTGEVGVITSMRYFMHRIQSVVSVRLLLE